MAIERVINISGVEFEAAVLNAHTNGDLSSVDNTTDANKPVSIATQTELDLKQVAVDAVGNDTDTYVGSPPIQQIISLTQAEYDAIGTPDANTLYMVV